MRARVYVEVISNTLNTRHSMFDRYAIHLSDCQTLSQLLHGPNIYPRARDVGKTEQELCPWVKWGLSPSGYLPDRVRGPIGWQGMGHGRRSGLPAPTFSSISFHFSRDVSVPRIMLVPLGTRPADDDNSADVRTYVRECTWLTAPLVRHASESMHPEWCISVEPWLVLHWMAGPGPTYLLSSMALVGHNRIGAIWSWV